MYNINRLWKKPTTYRMITFPDGSYGIERTSEKGKEYQSKYGSWCSDTFSIKNNCRILNAKDACEQLQWIRQEFPDAVIKEY